MKLDLLILCCLFLAGCNQPSTDAISKSEVAHYQLIGDSDGNAWMLDTSKGQVKRCWKGTPGVVDPICYTASQK